MLGNTKLVDYGIQTENSDIRVHVCPTARRIYYYNTSDGLDAIQTNKYRKVPVYTNGIKTAEGYLVPPDDIPGCMMIIPPIPGWHTYFNGNDTTSRKGELATRLTKKLIEMGELRLKLNPVEINDLDMQISGTDILIRADIKIQVKCDFNGGSKEFGGTGNLFLQIAECNPFRQT